MGELQLQNHVTVGMLRVKNEARWIGRCVASLLPVCDEVLVMDDHSTDATAKICSSLPGVRVLPSPFTGLDETRDKNWLLDQANADWIVMIDGDEALLPGHEDTLRRAMGTEYPCLSLPVWYLWDREDQRRIDGVYQNFRRPSIFRPNGARFASTSAGGNFHCGNVPVRIRHNWLAVDAPLLHFGYLHREDRVRKYAWYNAQDPGNGSEDSYRHMVIGDLFPAESKFAYGGPLELERISGN